MTRDGYECYKLYLALQRHFSTTYDFFTYNGKVNASVESYSKRPDVFKFEKLSKILPADQRLDFFVSHFITDSKMWIGNMSKQHYDNYKAKIKNFPKSFKEDLEYISQHNPKELMDIRDIPLIHKMCINKKVSAETLITMDKFFPFIDKHKAEVKVSIVFPDHITMLLKYRPFFEKNVTDIHKDIMKSVLIGK